MEKDSNTTPIALPRIQIRDAFWRDKMELVRREMIPYQWKALNDQVEGAEPSFCMHNFRVAGKMNRKRKVQGDAFEEPKYTFRGFQALPEDPEDIQDKFYGFVFQDSDLYKWLEAVAYYQATGKDRLLNAAKKFADHIDGYFGPEEGKCKGYPGHEIAEMALVRLYEATGEERYLNLSYFFVNERGKRPYYFDQERQSEKIGRDQEDALRYFYYQAHLPVREQKEVTGHAVRGVYLYSGMADLARLLSSIGAYAYTEREDVLFIHLYMESAVEKRVQGETGVISVASDYPWEGNVRVSVRGISVPFTVALRIPAWCEKVQVRGADGADTWRKNGYLYVRRIWGEKDFVELTFPMEVRILEADSRVREDAGKLAVMRGPLIYCMEEADNGSDLHLLSLDAASEAQVAEREIGGAAVKGITLGGYRREPVHVEGPGLYRAVRKAQETRVPLYFVPYYTWANRGENEMQVWTDGLSL